MIYLDYAATTPLDEEVLRAMTPYFSQSFGNAQSQHAEGRAAANAVTAARDKIASLIGCKSEEIYFVSGATEACNTALKGVLSARGKGHAVISAIEHPAVLESAKDMQKFGFDITFVDPDKDGVISPERVKKAFRDDTVFCAVMHANNETGVIQPVDEIGKACRERGIFYFCDCTQTAPYLPLPYAHCDGLCFSSHKMYGPKGAGILVVKKGNAFSRLISGGMQESGVRGGTVNAPAVVGAAKALELSIIHREENNAHIKEVSDFFINKILSEVDGAHLNGGGERLFSHANISFDGCNGENILFLLDLKGICVSTGSACSAGAVTLSHVILSMGLGEERARSAVRFTFGKHTTLKEAEIAANEVKSAVEKLRKG